MKKYKCDKCQHEDDNMFNIIMKIGEMSFDVCFNCFVNLVNANCGKVMEQSGETRE